MEQTTSILILDCDNSIDKLVYIQAEYASGEADYEGNGYSYGWANGAGNGHGSGLF